MLNLSPASKHEVSVAAARGVRKTKQEESPQPNVGNRASRFLDDVTRSLVPIAKHVCSLSKFNNMSKLVRVMKRVLQRMSMKRKRSGTTVENLGSKPKITVNTKKRKGRYDVAKTRWKHREIFTTNVRILETGKAKPR